MMKEKRKNFNVEDKKETLKRLDKDEMIQKTAGAQQRKNYCRLLEEKEK